MVRVRERADFGQTFQDTAHPCQYVVRGRKVSAPHDNVTALRACAQLGELRLCKAWARIRAPYAPLLETRASHAAVALSSLQRAAFIVVVHR